jgi:choline dehydrogenase-like flavoprotein
VVDRYDVAIVGTGFASSFFLYQYLQRAGADVRILVLERGNADTKPWQLQHRASSSIGLDQVYRNATPEKLWLTSPGFGGNSKCWWAGTLRMMPNDFRLRSRYGVGDDWPLSYEDLDPWYTAVEDIMMVSGADTPMPRSKPYPLPPHRFSDPDELLKKAFPQAWFHPATARASIATGKRGVCCASGICDLCPVDAKFTVQNGLAEIYRDPRVTLKLNAPVEVVETRAGLACGVTYLDGGRAVTAPADLVVLGASALFNPHILLRSGIDDRLIGKRLSEQYALNVCIDLDGVKAYNGSTVITGNGYLFYDGEHRRDHAACMIETWTSPFTYQEAPLRTEPGRWTERQYFRFIFDETPLETNTVGVCKDDPRLALTAFHGYSDYAKRGARQIPKMIDKLATALPIERIVDISEATTSGHIQGTVVMGTDASNSVVDGFLAHHRIRNLLVLGASAFPTAIAGLPTLTLSALAMRAADQLFNDRTAAPRVPG